MSSYRIVVDGLVQGVGFRDFTCREAALLDLKGYVRNMGDGSVEVVAQGDPETVHTLIKRLWQGPGAARVASVDINEYTGGRQYDVFKVRRDAN